MEIYVKMRQGWRNGKNLLLFIIVIFQNTIKIGKYIDYILDLQIDCILYLKGSVESLEFLSLLVLSSYRVFISL